MSWYYNDWKPYVPVAERRRKALKKMESLRKKGIHIQPVTIGGRKIAKTFWGEAWCNHLESFSDYANRLPRGRTYVRNGSVCHLAVAKGEIEAKVSGSELYTVKIAIKTLAPKKWNEVKRRCTGRIGSLLELLQGNLSDEVMEVVTDRQNGLFPLPGEISLKCSCPDWATMCKHVAAVLYGIGARLDHKPEMLFLLRGVDHEELIAADAEAAVSAATSGGKSKRLSAGELSDVFGIDLDATQPEPPPQTVSVEEANDSCPKPVKKKIARKPAGTAKSAAPRKKKTPKKVAKKTPERAAKKPQNNAEKRKKAGRRELRIGQLAAS
jgi:uncharacterized Zn finger protein